MSNGDAFRPRKAAAKLSKHSGRDGRKRVKMIIVPGPAGKPGDARQFMAEEQYFLKWWNGEIPFCYLLEVEDSAEWLAAQAARNKSNNGAS